MRGKRATALIALAIAALVCGVAVAKPKKPKPSKQGFQTTVKPYAKGVPGYGWVTKPILSVGDVVPETGNSGGQYRMVGIPDGLGVERRHKTHRVWMTHELTATDVSEPRVGRPLQRGAFATQLVLNRKGKVVSARRAFDTVYQDSTLVGPAAAGPTPSFDPKGSQSVAIFNNQAHALSKLGHFPKENTVVMRGTGKRTVILTTEDGPRTTDSQLYMYVGRKVRSSSNPLRRNGLDNGKLYVFASDDATKNDENKLLQGDSVHGTWKEIPNADTLTDVQTEAAADAVGAFGFVRIEDGEFKPNAKRTFWFDTTGDQQSANEADPHTNELGRLYSLKFDGRDPLKGATLTQRYNADQLTAQQDGPLSPDNVAVTKRFVAVNEDGTGGGAPGGTGSRDDMEARNRDGSIWMVPLASAGDSSTFTRAGELIGRSEGGRDGIQTTSGIWETSGIVGSRHAFGANTFLFDVQAHPPTTAPGGTTVTVEDGQLLLLHK